MRSHSHSKDVGRDASTEAMGVESAADVTEVVGKVLRVATFSGPYRGGDTIQIAGPHGSTGTRLRAQIGTLDELLPRGRGVRGAGSA